jgi:hypothetical protein
MAENILKTDVKRDKNTLYWVDKGGIFAKPRKQPGVPEGKKTKVADHDIELDRTKYLYFLKGDPLVVARAERQVGGSKRKKSARKASAPKRGGGKKGGAKRTAKKAASRGGKKGGKKRR